MSDNKITIVTPSFNQGQFLEETILSVLEQNFPRLEYIVIDGGSTDNSVDIIKKYQKHLAFWVTERDKGQTDAINKGFRRATGDVVNWLNSDDLLEPGALQVLDDYLNQYPAADVYFGDYRAVDARTETIYVRKSAPYVRSSLFWGRQLSSQPAVFFRRRLLETLGMLDERLFFCMDIEFWIRAAQNGARFQQIKSVLSATRVHGDAKTSKYQKILHDEHKNVVRKHKALSWFEADSNLEDAYYTVMNRGWRTMAAIGRMICRGDGSFKQASLALANLKKGN